MYNPFSLEGKIILITGASSGIGRSTAIECSKLGARVILTARNESRLQETLSLMERQEEHKIIIADMSYEVELDHLVQNVEDKIDGLVNNAGYIITTPIKFINSDKVKDIFMVNAFAPILLVQKLLKNRKFAKNASIVFTSSIGGTKIGSIGNSLYSATKSGISGFAKNAALEFAQLGIRVNTVCPGMIQTSIMKTGTISDEQLNIDMQKYPLKRYGKPEEVAFGIIYLLSDASTFTVGSDLVIDGGYSIQ